MEIKDKPLNSNEFKTIISPMGRTAFHIQQRFMRANPSSIKPLVVLSKSQWIQQNHLKTPYAQLIISKDETLWLWLETLDSTPPKQALSLFKRAQVFIQLGLTPDQWDASWDATNQLCAQTYTTLTKQFEQHSLIPEPWLTPKPTSDQVLLTHFEQWLPHELACFVEYQKHHESCTNRANVIGNIHPNELDETMWLVSAIYEWHQQGKHIAIITPNIDQLYQKLIHHIPSSQLKEMVDVGLPITLEQHPVCSTLLSLLNINYDGYNPSVLHQWQQHALIRPSLKRAPSSPFTATINEEYLRSEHLPSEWKEEKIIQWIDQLIVWQKAQYTPNQWIERIISAAKSLGWPHAQPDQHTTFVVHQLKRCFHGWQHNCHPVNFTTFINRLTLIMQQHHIQLTHEWKPLTILKPEEAFGLTFEHIHLIGFHQDTWPINTSPPHWLPPSAHDAYLKQRQTSDDLDALLHASPSVSLSHVGEVDTCVSLQSGIQWQQQQHTWSPMTLTHTHEHYQPSKTTLSFSTSALKTQAQCPFKSLIIHQLNTPNETEPQLGLTPSDRGALVHEVIERLHKTHFDTQNISDQTLHKTIAYVLNQWQKRLPTSLSGAFKSIEHRRLAGLLQDWLQHEQQLPQPQRRLIEQSFEYNIQSHSLKLRADRIDKHHDGDVIIDYKTGLTHPKEWFDERMTEPQLPLYALSNESVKGMFIYRIHHSGIDIKGIDIEHDRVVGINTTVPDNISWSTLRTQWQATINNLVQEIKDGLCTITPSIKGCEYCHLKSVCRINELKEYHASH